MSASEKLRVLNGREMVRLEAASYLAGEKDHVVPDELYAALPQIVAVVEAAEMLIDADCNSLDRNQIQDQMEDVSVALAALDDALVTAES